MQLQFKSLSKNGKQAFYSGAAKPIRFALTAFVDGIAPEVIEVADGTFAAPKPPKVKLTAEERKALRAAKPKPTLAEVIAQREAKLNKLKAQLAEAEVATL